jgi:peptidoglycan/xylan/chitin deacetylase (PgdA/CDA1 family)
LNRALPTARDEILALTRNDFQVTFDDGPSDASPSLYDFLAENKISDVGTHFVIGSNVLS